MMEEKLVYDFDTVISRKGSGDLMHGALLPRWGRDDLLPMWVADMDFAVCPDILDALRKRLGPSDPWLYYGAGRLFPGYS